MVDEILAHHGIKGMKWGVRRDHPAVGVAKNALDVVRATPKTSDTKKTFNAKVSAAGGIHKVSDAELKTMLERLNMEKRYSDIVNADAKKRAEHRAAVGRVLLEIGKVAIPLIVGAAAAKTASGGTFRTKAYTHGPKVINGVSRALGS